LAWILRAWKRKERGKKKNFIAAQPDLLREHASHHRKVDDSQLPTPPWMEDLGNKIDSHEPPEWYGCQQCFLNNIKLLKITKQPLTKSKNKKTKTPLYSTLIFFLFQEYFSNLTI
jgi:hypothetical protein